MNIILLIIDTLRYDAVSVNGGSIPTPNLDHLASESIIFDRAFCASFPTIPFRTDVMTGRYGGPFHTWHPLPHAAATIVDAIKEQGYATQLIHDTPHLVNGGHNFDYPFHTWTFVRGAEVDRAWLRDEADWLPNWRHDTLFDPIDAESVGSPSFAAYSYTNRDRTTEPDWNCARLFDTVARFLEDNRNRENLFLWVDCFDPHEPWDAPPQFVRQFDPRPHHDGSIDPRQFWGGRNSDALSSEAKAVMASLYSAKVSWMDHCLGRFLDTFYTTGLASNTALIVVGDHGTNTGDFGRFGKGIPVRDREAHVPLFIRLPERETARSDALVQPQDLSATLLELAGAMLDGCEGHHLLAESSGRPAALGGPSPTWATGWSDHFFSVFAEEFWMEWHPQFERTILRRYLVDEPVRGEENERKRLHRLGRSEIEARGAHPELIAWLDRGAEDELPAGVPLHAFWPGIPGFTPYFRRTYAGM